MNSLYQNTYHKTQLENMNTLEQVKYQVKMTLENCKNVFRITEKTRVHILTFLNNQKAL